MEHHVIFRMRMNEISIADNSHDCKDLKLEDVPTSNTSTAVAGQNLTQHLLSHRPD